MRTAFAGDTAAERRLTIEAGACLVVGVVVIVVGAVAGWGWTRIIGAVLITVGSGVLGALIAFVEPRRREARARIMAARGLIAIVVAVVLILPVAIALVGAMIGLFSGAGSGGMRALGALVALLLLVATVGSAVIAVRATQRAGIVRREVPSEEGA